MPSQHSRCAIEVYFCCMNSTVLRCTAGIAWLILCVLLPGCRTASVSDFTTSNKAIRVDRPMFDVFASRLTDSSAQFRFVTTSTLRTDDNTIRYVDLVLRASDAPGDTLLVFPTIARDEVPGSPLYIIGEALWESPALRSATSVTADVSVVTATDHIVFSQIVDVRDPVALDLYPRAEATSDSTLVFRCMARRVFVPRGEYLPSSEVFRVRVMNEQGELVWSSDDDMAFLALVSLVQPQTSGRIHIYEMPWNARTANGLRLKPGTYTADFIIPSRPIEYGTRMTFQWPLR